MPDRRRPPTLALRSYLTDRLDSEVQASLAPACGRARRRARPRRPATATATTTARLRLGRGYAAGTLERSSRRRRHAARRCSTASDRPVTLSAASARRRCATCRPTASPHDVDLPGLRRLPGARVSRRAGGDARRRAADRPRSTTTVAQLVVVGGAARRCSASRAAAGAGDRPGTPPAAAAARGRRHRAPRSPSCRWRPARSSSPSGCPSGSPTSAPRSARSAPPSTPCSPTSSRRSTARHESEQQVRQFVADASHELRTPLTTIRGLRRAGPAPPRRPGARCGPRSARSRRSRPG